MRAPGDWMARWSAAGQRLRVGAVALALTLGCAADRPGAEGETRAGAATAPTLARRPPTLSSSPATLTASGVPLVRTKLPPPVAMPGGGTRIDMRGSGQHVRVLERQADGTYKHACEDAPDLMQRRPSP